MNDFDRAQSAYDLQYPESPEAEPTLYDRWQQLIDDAADEAFGVAGVTLERDALAVDTDDETVTWQWGVIVESLNPADLASALEAAAARIRATL